MFAVFTRNFGFDFGDFIRGQLAHGRGDGVFAQRQRAALPVVSRQAVVDYRLRYGLAAGTAHRPFDVIDRHAQRESARHRQSAVIAVCAQRNYVSSPVGRHACPHFG